MLLSWNQFKTVLFPFLILIFIACHNYKDIEVDIGPFSNKTLISSQLVFPKNLPNSLWTIYHPGIYTSTHK